MSVDRARSPGERARTPLSAAIGAARWIRSAAADDGPSRHWRANPDAGARPALAPEPACLYTGAPGIVLFFLELAAATGDDGYLDDARAGVRYLASAWQGIKGIGFHHGLSGIAAAAWRDSWSCSSGCGRRRGGRRTWTSLTDWART
ncbi:Lanthionine synthetase C-like protein [Nonomuraea solani]|uniref:Lanthionine synthetase C-like protein n=1 Tax=Nonomuraea solani TaxID=1144553 RepID=A0A1H6EUE0_9ACTN|nr:lanthionine synthetase LanC family protein [Nonomuraea solani]SEH01487.1 Lanthionine synthetase C-like protein [Nonomuraea solani]